ncbi:MAG: DegT/DnrJ/EryC1/StrS aminotransferase family protein [Bryobacterales bacterium]|nr:DegT/DnrJ/EryC1/StrS aminotransferase family protein [Bryobacterales bacterium]
MRSQFLPYCLPTIGEEEIAEVVDSLRSGWVTTGPKTKRFEQQFAAYVGCRHAIAVNSCTAALHLSLAALGVGPGDEVIVPTMTFCATANVVRHLGANPVLIDVDEDGLLDIQQAERNISPQTKAIIPVHFAGQACPMDEVYRLTAGNGVTLVQDAAHAVGASYRGAMVGALGQAIAFSFYATKNMTTGEGGMIATDDDGFAETCRRLSLHGMSRDAWKRYSETGSWYYEVTEPGYKDNMTDIQASLGIHQLQRLPGFIERRRHIAAIYNDAFGELPGVRLPRELEGRRHVYHLYPIRVNAKKAGIARGAFIEELRRRNIGSSVHFIPLHRHPAYRDARQHCRGGFRVADELYDEIVSLPLYPGMTDGDVQDVIEAVREISFEHQPMRVYAFQAATTTPVSNSL